MSSDDRSSTAIIGAGPFGVSIAACLNVLDAKHRIFGIPISHWHSKMPRRMLLKSESCASNLYHPMGQYTLAQYCREVGEPYPEYGTPVSRELFAKYALSFQQRFVPNVEPVTVTNVRRLNERFELELSTGEKFQTGKVIVASGMDHMAHIPEQLAALPSELRSHTADHSEFDRFKGKDVVVVGGGQSALETAALLREDGASVTLLVREPSLAWNSPPVLTHRSAYERLRAPRTMFGDGLNLWVYDNLPGLFHYLPQDIRVAKVKTALGPAGAWWLKERVVGQLPILSGHRLIKAGARGSRVVLEVSDSDGKSAELMADHVIAGTGYRFNVGNLPFLSQDLKHQLRCEQGSPKLSSNFEASVSGLYFTGLGSANSFGPVMRFLAGTDFTARRISTHIARSQGTQVPSLARFEKCPEF